MRSANGGWRLDDVVPEAEEILRAWHHVQIDYEPTDSEARWQCWRAFIDIFSRISDGHACQISLHPGAIICSVAPPDGQSIVEDLLGYIGYANPGSWRVRHWAGTYGKSYR